MEHAIAEYDLRPGAVPIFIQLENEGFRGATEIINNTLTREGTLAALASKNVILNVLTPTPFDVVGATATELGVDADQADGAVDQLHTLYTQNGASFDAGVYNDALPQDQIVADTTAEDAYIRVAWETGGGAWNLSAVEAGVTSDSADALRDALVDSLVSQVLRADAAGEVFRTPELVAAINLGGSFATAVGDFTADPDPSAPLVRDINPFFQPLGLSASAPDDVPLSVFSTARFSTAGQPIDLTVDTASNGAPLPDGFYTVELLFNEFSSTSTVFDVFLEGEQVLDAYDISSDRIVVSGVSATEQFIATAGQDRRTAKRYGVEVTGGDGLQLQITGANGRLAGVRLFAAAPRVTNVVVERFEGGQVVGSVDLGAQVSSDEQLKNIGLPGANRVRVTFDRPISAPAAGDLQVVPLLLKTNQSQAVQPTTVTLAPDGLSATWTLGQALASDFYALRLENVFGDANGAQLDGEWTNPDVRDGASGSSQLVSGDGAAGGEFQFAFTQLLSDFDTDNDVDLVDLDTLGANFLTLMGALFSEGDTDGDGDVDLVDLDTLGAEFLETLQLLALQFDYDNDLDVDAADEAEFATRLAASDATTDLNNDGLFDATDQAIFDMFFPGLSLT